MSESHNPYIDIDDRDFESEADVYDDLLNAAITSTEFWNNSLDDAEWNSA